MGRDATEAISKWESEERASASSRLDVAQARSSARQMPLQHGRSESRPMTVARWRNGEGTKPTRCHIEDAFGALRQLAMSCNVSPSMGRLLAYRRA
jgi:hypothetical protein